MAVTVVNAGTADSDIRSGHATYSTARAGGGTFTIPAVSANELHEGQLIFGSYLLHEAFVAFDLAAIPVGNVVTSAVLETYLVTDSSTTNFTCIAIYFDWGASVTSADWQDGTELAGETWWTNIPTNGIGATGAYKSWADNSDIRALTQLFAGATMHLVLTSDRQVAGIAPPDSEFVIWASANTANPPRLTVTHHNTLLEHTTEGGLALGGSPEWDFTSGAAATGVLSDIVVEWDLDNDGDFSESVEDITPYVISAETVTGRDFPSGLTGETKPGQLKLTLLNEDDRFSYFNSGSPLATAPMSLRTGRKIRVRTADAVDDEPVLLVRDRFNRADGALGTAETGQTWTNEVGAFEIVDKVATPDETTFAPTIVFATIDTGETDMYVQATLRFLTRSDVVTRTNGLVARWTDINNHTRFTYLTDTGLRIIDRASGVDTVLATYAVDLWEGVVIGVGIVGQAVTGYVGGVPVATATLTGAIDGTRAGLSASYGSTHGRPPEIADFHVWDHVGAQIDGILWTGDVADLQIDPSLGTRKTATVTADGRLARAAAVTIASPRLAIAGAPTGLIVGDVLHRAGMLHPPIPLDEGSVTTGRVGIDDGDALSIARMFEDTEQGILYETNEGPISFQDATSRAGAASMAWFSDTPGVGQYGYHEIVPLDRRSQLINRVTAGVAPGVPTIVSIANQAGNEHLEVTLPTIADGDLMIVFVGSSQDGNQDWLAPIWWTPHRGLKGGRWHRAYSHHCRPSDPSSYGSGATVRFRTWDGSEAGLWRTTVVQVRNWFGAASGIAMGDFAPGNVPGPLSHGWGRAPTQYFVFSGGIRGDGAPISLDTPTDPPDGYGRTNVGGITSSGVDFYDLGSVISQKVDCTETEEPTSYSSIADAIVHESVIFAVRGYNGPFTKQTLHDPNSVGGFGRPVTVDNLDSQADYNAVLSHAEPSHLFASEADAEAYGESIVATYGEERQILELSFWAMSSAALRAQALARRVGDKITVTALGTTGLGIQADYYIESIRHLFTDGGTKHLCTWAVSPA